MMRHDVMTSAAGIDYSSDAAVIATRSATAATSPASTAPTFVQTVKLSGESGERQGRSERIRCGT